jgi:hypothetical protein
MRPSCPALAAVLAGVCFVTQAAAQDPRLERVDSTTRAVVTALVDSARAAGLPAEPLVQRALEGATKGAPGDRIVAAVRRLAVDLDRARGALGSATGAAELEAGASALRAGASPAVLTRLHRARRAPLIVPLAVLADLVAGGVPPDAAASAVLTLAVAEDAELIEFRRNVERDIALGAPPAAAAAVRLGSTADATPQSTGGHPPSQPRRP